MINSKYSVLDQFADVSKMVKIDVSTKEIIDYKLTRYARYLISTNVKNIKEANNIHYEIGKQVRKAIKDMGGTLPENLPKPNKSLKQLKREETKKQLIK